MMESAGGSSMSAATVSAAMPSPSHMADSTKATKYEFDPSVAEEERRFYLKAYPTVDIVRDRKTHCTVCKTHIGTAPVQENGMKMHPILRVTHCNKCHDFYNSGEFSKGEDGSELYCRWCGQGGEVYCCSSCPYVFCKSCIVKNLSKGVVADIEQNENWNCFSCAPKILWPLRAQHWALMNYIEQQKKEIYAMNLSEPELKQYLSRDASKCCRLAKAKCGNMSDSMESLDSVNSKRSHGSGSAKKPVKHPAASPQQMNAAKRAKTNDEVVCTPDLLSMLEPDCQITVSPKAPSRPMQSPSATTPKIMSIQQPQGSFGGQMSSTPKSNAPPPLVLRNTAIKLRPAAPQPVVRRTIIGPRTPAPGGNGSPVYHVINGYRIDLNSAAQQETFRLPNGKLIQVKRQGPPAAQNAAPSSAPNSWQQMNQPQPQRIVPQTIASRAVQITPHPYNIQVQQQQQQGGPPQMRQYQNMIGSTSISSVNHNGNTIQVLNGQMNATPQQQQQHLQQQQQQQQLPGQPLRPVMIRHVFPDTPVGSARNGLQEQVFNAMEICTHLTNKVQTLTNSNAYKQARNFLEVKELYIHLSYLLTYAIGRFKGLQDKCLGDMRTLGFGNDADSLENGQLAAAVDYVCYGQLDEVDLFNTGSNSFHNQVYEYRKSLHANLKEGEDGAKSPLPPLFPLGQGKPEEIDDDDVEGEDSLLETPKTGGLKGHWLEGGVDSPVPPSYNQENEENEEPEESYMDNDDDEGFNRSLARGSYGGDSFMQGTEESMRRNEETHAYDRKLTRLVAQYPSIWCIRHPDYGNFEVTRKHWRTIASHFDRNEQIKLRWKNIRKRFVRIEKRIAEGKRFNGHFDKAMAFLANRDLPEDQWVPVDCGEDDGDTYDRCNLDAIEQSLHLQGKDDFAERTKEKDRGIERNLFSFQPAVKPIDIEPMDLKIMNFVKVNPVLWRKSMDPEADKIDEQTRKAVWNQLQRHMPHKQASDDEDNEIEIVEPKTDLINLDSDDDEPAHSSPIKTVKQTSPVKTNKNYSHTNDVKVRPGMPPAAGNRMATIRPILPKSVEITVEPTLPPEQSPAEENMDLMSMAQSFLASMLEVDIHEGPYSNTGSETGLKKQPRKKLTNKPNPTLLKQKALMERERLEEMKRNDLKLKMKCAVALKKAEDEFPYAKEMLEAKAREDEQREQERKEEEAQSKLVVDTGKELFDVEVVIDEDVLNSSGEEKKKSEDLTNENEEKSEKTEKTAAEISEKTAESEDKENSMDVDEKEISKTNEECAEKKTTTEEEEDTDKCSNAGDAEVTEKSKEELKEKSVEVIDDDKDKSVEVIDDDKDKSVEVIDDDKDKSGEVIDDDKDKSEEVKEKELNEPNTATEKGDETKDQEKDKSLGTEDEEKDKSMEDEEKDKSLGTEDEDKDKSMEDGDNTIDEKEKKTMEIEDEDTSEEAEKSDKSLDQTMEETEPTLLEEVKSKDKQIENIKTNGNDEIDKIEEDKMEEETETEENNEEPMEVDEKESPKKSNIAEDEETNDNEINDLDVDKEIEKVLQKHPDNDADESEECNEKTENTSPKPVSTDSDKDEVNTNEKEIIPDLLTTAAGADTTPSNKDITDNVITSEKEQTTVADPKEAAESTTTTTTSAPSNDTSMVY